MKTSALPVTFCLALVLVLVLAGCPSSTGPSTTSTTVAVSSHSFADASQSMAAYSAALSAAAANIGGSGTATATMSGNTLTITLANYSSNGISVSGTLTEVLSPFSVSGTLNFSGGGVTQIVYNSITGTSGTLTIKFSDNSSWSYSYATTAFTRT